MKPTPRCWKPYGTRGFGRFLCCALDEKTACSRRRYQDSTATARFAIKERPITHAHDLYDRLVQSVRCLLYKPRNSLALKFNAFDEFEAKHKTMFSSFDSAT